MLVLTRRLNEVLVIGNNVRVVVLAVYDNQVKIGIEAPKEISIHRQEVYYRIHSEVSASCTQPLASIGDGAEMSKG